MESLGFKPGETYAALASYGEVVSGLLIALGAGGPVGPAMLLSNMLVAQTTVHAKNGFFASKNGVEVGVLYASGALALASTGYGSVSLDRALGLDQKLSHPVLKTADPRRRARRRLRRARAAQHRSAARNARRADDEGRAQR